MNEGLVHERTLCFEVRRSTSLTTPPSDLQVVGRKFELVLALMPTTLDISVLK